MDLVLVFRNGQLDFFMFCQNFFINALDFLNFKCLYLIEISSVFKNLKKIIVQNQILHMNLLELDNFFFFMFCQKFEWELDFFNLACWESSVFKNFKKILVQLKILHMIVFLEFRIGKFCHVHILLTSQKKKKKLLNFLT